MDLKVYNPDGSYVGQIVDVSFEIGGNRVGLLVKVDANNTVEIGMDKVKGARDIVILADQIDVARAKVQTPQVALESKGTQPRAEPKELMKDAQGKVVCPTCGKRASWIKEYNRWYCYNDKKYL